MTNSNREAGLPMDEMIEAALSEMPVIRDVVTHVDPATMERSFTIHTMPPLEARKYVVKMIEAAIKAMGGERDTPRLRALVEAVNSLLKANPYERCADKPCPWCKKVGAVEKALASLPDGLKEKNQ